MQRHMVEAVRQAGLLPRVAWPPEAAAEPPVPEEVVVPEPDASMVAYLGDMGFSAAAARRALLLSAGQMNAAVNYLVAHGAEDAEPAMEELQYAPALCLHVSMEGVVRGTTTSFAHRIALKRWLLRPTHCNPLHPACIAGLAV